MKLSQYILDIFDLTFDEFESENLLRSQIPYLTISDTEHSGVGIFINFQATKEADKYRIPVKEGLSLDVDGNPFEMLNGVEITNDDLHISADAIVYITNGIISSLEIFNKNEESYPADEPEHYELNQTWEGLTNRRSIKR